MKKGGGIVAFEIKGGLEQGRCFLNSVKLCSLSANLGDTRSIASHPASTTHAKLTEEEQFKKALKLVQEYSAAPQLSSKE